MTQERYDELMALEGAINLGHPEFDRSFHKDFLPQLTVLICQRKTFRFTQLCVESLLRFYPDIKILVVDGDSKDDSTLYLRYKALTTPNLKLYERLAPDVGENQNTSHGFTLHDAITNHIDTPFVLTMDSDTIVNRGGWIEQLLWSFDADPNQYAAGHLMLVSLKNYGVGAPADDNDVLRYAHPSCAMFRVSTYKELRTPFNDNGSPLAHNMIAAHRNNYTIKAFPIDKYVSHRMGTSWVREHQIIWKDDYDVFIRPFITFIVSHETDLRQLENQADKDFNMVILDNPKEIRIWLDETRDINNRYWGIRNSVNGEYVCHLTDAKICDDMVREIKFQIIEQGAPEQINVDGLELFERKFWQRTKAIG